MPNELEAHNNAWNLGEWSELYVLAMLLIQGGASGSADGEHALDSDFHRILEVILPAQGLEKRISFKLKDGQIIRCSDDFIQSHVDIETLNNLGVQFFQQLTAPSNKSTFESEFGNQLLKLLGRTSPSATSASQVNDLELVLIDQWAGAPTPPVGFSIKSQVGSPATLLNASGATNFEFQIAHDATLNFQEIVEESKGSVQKLVKNLLLAGCKLEFNKILSPSFEHKLNLLDSKMVENVADLVKTFYSSEFNLMSDVTNLAFPSSSPNSSQKVFKTKQFLGAIAMGLRPSGDWDGDVTKFKGMIIVKKSGQILLFYVHNLLPFQDFLFSSVKFEVASTKRHKFGAIFQRDGEHYIVLNLQIRFIS